MILVHCIACKHFAGSAQTCLPREVKGTKKSDGNYLRKKVKISDNHRTCDVALLNALSNRTYFKKDFQKTVVQVPNTSQSNMTAQPH